MDLGQSNGVMPFFCSYSSGAWEITLFGRPRDSSIRLLGPEHVTVAAGAVRLSLSWSALAIIEAVGELDDDGKLPDKSAGEEPPVEELSRRVHSASEALNHFDRMAADEIQDRRLRRLPGRLTGNRGRGRPDGAEDQDY